MTMRTGPHSGSDVAAGPAGGGFASNLPDLLTAAGHVDEVANTIDRQLKQLMGELEPMVNTWKGGAATTFGHVKDKWLDDAHRINRSLHTMADGLRQTHKGYQSSEDWAQQQMNTIGHGQL